MTCGCCPSRGEAIGWAMFFGIFTVVLFVVMVATVNPIAAALITAFLVAVYRSS